MGRVFLESGFVVLNGLLDVTLVFEIHSAAELDGRPNGYGLDRGPIRWSGEIQFFGEFVSDPHDDARERPVVPQSELLASARRGDLLARDELLRRFAASPLR